MKSDLSRLFINPDPGLGVGPEIPPPSRPAPGAPKPGDPPGKPLPGDPPPTKPTPGSPGPIRPQTRVTSGRQAGQSTG